MCVLFWSFHRAHGLEQLAVLDTLQRSRKKGVELGPRPGGPRIRSGVVVPPSSGSGSGGVMDMSVSGKEEGDGDEKMVDLDDL